MASVFYIDVGYSKETHRRGQQDLRGVHDPVRRGPGRRADHPGGDPADPLSHGGAASALTNLLFVVIASTGANVPLLIATICADNVSGGMATSPCRLPVELTNLRFSATQYAMLSSLMLLLPRLLGGYSGAMVEHVGYSSFFSLTALMGVPTLLLIAVLWLRQRRTAIPSGPSGSGH